MGCGWVVQSIWFFLEKFFLIKGEALNYTGKNEYLNHIVFFLFKEFSFAEFLPLLLDFKTACSNKILNGTKIPWIFSFR